MQQDKTKHKNKFQNKGLPKTLWKFIFYFLKQQSFAFFIFFLTPFFLLIDTNLIPYCFKLIIDGITDPNIDRQNIFAIIRVPLLLSAISWVAVIIIMRLQSYWQAFVVPKFQADMRMEILGYVTKHSYNFFSNQLSGNIANKINDLTRAVENIRNIITWNILSTIVVTLVSLLIMATINITFCIIICCFVIVTTILITPQAKNINKLAEQNADTKSQLMGIIVDTLINITSVKLFASRKLELNHTIEKQNEERSSNKKLILGTNIYKLYMDIPSTIMLAFITYYLITYWQANKITTGDFVFIFNSSFVIINQIWQISWVLTMLFSEIGIAKQALSIVIADHEITDLPNAKDLKVTNGKIEFQNVTFHYDDRAKIFNNQNIVIKPGEKVGLVGYSGSGKSTFVNLILRFFDVQSGIITIDNQDISKVTQDSLRHNISMIPQDPNLFHRSLLDNIKYGNPEATLDEVINAAKQANCHDFIMELPQQYNTVVGERGIKLSGGQRQRIAIARAMLENAPILILDEATSSLDSLTEKVIQDSLSILMRNRTTIVIAHRLSTLLTMDRILVFDKGKIIEDGAHKDLLKANGHFAKLWQMQIAGFLPDKPDSLDISKTSIALYETV